VDLEPVELGYSPRVTQVLLPRGRRRASRLIRVSPPFLVGSSGNISPGGCAIQAAGERGHPGPAPFAPSGSPSRPAVLDEAVGGGGYCGGGETASGPGLIRPVSWSTSDCCGYARGISIRTSNSMPVTLRGRDRGTYTAGYAGEPEGTCWASIRPVTVRARVTVRPNRKPPTWAKEGGCRAPFAEA